MARPKPWLWKDRGARFVTVQGKQHNLGPDKRAAFERFFHLMRKPQLRTVSPHSLVAIIVEFLDCVQKNRATANYEGYRYPCSGSPIVIPPSARRVADRGSRRSQG